MDWKNVTTHSIARIRYDLSNRTLEVKLNGGRVFRYYEVPRSVYAGMLLSESIATYFHDWIHERYPCVQLA